jgi:general stress protein 26
MQNLRAKIEDIRFGMMTTLNDDQSLSSRPMTQQAIDDNGTLWFFTSDDSQLARDITHHPKINVSFAKPSDNTYVTTSGEASLIKNREKATQLWNPMVSLWFPLGVDDPHLALIKFTIHEAEYWDSDSNKMLHLFAMAKAAITGEPPKDAAEHQKIQF